MMMLDLKTNFRFWIPSTLAGICAVVGFSTALAKEKIDPRKAEILQLTNVWNVHLKFTAKEWAAMEPSGGGFGGFGGPGGGARGGPGRGGFGPAMFIAPAFLGRADTDRDGKISQKEFESLGDGLFAAWDKDQRGKLNGETIREGLNKTFSGGPGGPGGGPGRGGPGLNLQGAEGKRNGLASATGVDFNFVHADLELDGKTYADVGVRFKGNGTFMQSRGSNKRSFKVDLDHNHKELNLAGMTKLNLHNNVTDASWMNEPLSHRLYRDAGVPAPRSAYARVYVTVDGKSKHEYLGVYSIIENVDKAFAEERFGKKAAIFKPVTRNPFEYLGDDWKQYNQTYDPKTSLTPAQKQRVIDFCKLVSKGSDEEFAAKLGDYLDLDQFARYMAVTVWLSTLDSILTIGQNYLVLLHPESQKLQFVPWDLDHSFGQFPMMGSQDQRDKLSIQKPWQGSNLFLERVFKTESFKKAYLARMTEFSKSIFTPSRFTEQVDLVAKVLAPAVREESPEKFARFEKVTGGQSVEPAGFGGDGPRFMPGGFGQVKPIKAFVQVRAESVNAQLAGKSEGESIDSAMFGGGRGGPGGGAGGPPGPGMFLGGPFLTALDVNKDGEVTSEEFKRTFQKWFRDWNADKSGFLTEDQLRDGINRDLSPFGGGGGPGGPGGPGPTRLPLGGPPPQ